MSTIASRTIVTAALALVAILLVPSCAAAASDKLAAWNDAAAHADTGQANVVFLGSSSTYGTGASTPAKRYVDLVTARLGGGPVTRVGGTFPTRTTTPGVHGYLSAAGGTTSENYVNDTTRAFIAWERPSLVVHMIGSNDSIDVEPYAVTAAEYQANVASQVDRLDAASSQPMSHLLVHTFRRDTVSVAKWETYRRALENVAASRPNVAVLDISREFEVSDHMGADPDGLISADGTHPSDAGHALMADLIADFLAPAPSAVTSIPAPAAAEVVAAPVTASVAAPDVAAPAAPRKVKAVRDGRRVTVSWRGQSADYLVRCGGRTAEVNGQRATVRSPARSCRVRAVGAGGVSAWSVAQVRA